MNVYTSVATCQAATSLMGDKIAFIPTMGALHRGHLELIRTAQEMTDDVVVSIFVNPTQFNDQADFEKYPRPLLKDIHQLEKLGTLSLFAPVVSEVYSDKNEEKPIELDHLMRPLEGMHRPGHFDGVVSVMQRLLYIVKPDVLIMGQKDFQQLIIVKEMIQQLKLQIKLIGHPIVREPDGLALSSRNVRIPPELRTVAPEIYRTLLLAKTLRDQATPKEVSVHCTDRLSQFVDKVEYFQVVNPSNLLPLRSWSETENPIACAAVWLGKVRLIDNLFLNQNPPQ